MHFSVMVACLSNGGIGSKGTIPWYLSNDLKYFQRITTSAPKGKINAVIMGRKTWESLPKRPLKDRLNVVISNSITGNDIAPEGNIVVAPSLHHALEHLTSISESYLALHEIFVIGGGQLYRTALTHPDCRKIYVTHIQCFSDVKVDCDTFFPIELLEGAFRLAHRSDVHCQKGFEFTFDEYVRINNDLP